MSDRRPERKGSSCVCGQERAHFRLTGPREIACLPLRFQIAQKLHAATERPAGRENHRFRDLVDLLLLRDLVDDVPALREACVNTFERRAMHAWPPELTVPEAWRDGYRLLAGELDLTVTDVAVAADDVRALIARIDSA